MATLRDIDKYINWNPQRQTYEMVFWRRNVLPNWLYFDLSDVNVGGLSSPLTIAAAGTPTRPVSYKQQYTSVNGLDEGLGNPFAVQSLIFEDSTDGTAAADFTVMLKEMGEVREFMNRPVHVRTLYGTAQQPGFLREPYLFLGQHNIQFQAAKVAGGATTARLYMAGSQYYPWDPELIAKPDQKRHMVDLLRRWINRRKYVTPFWFTTDTPAVLGANATAQFRIKNGDDAQFECFALSAVSTGNFAISIVEIKTKQTWMNGQITQTNGIGTARFPTILPMPYLLPGGNFLNVTLTDLSGAPNTIFLTLAGRRIYSELTKVNEVLQDTKAGLPIPADTPTMIIPKPL